MTTPLLCLLGFAAWTILVVLVGIGVPRVSAVLLGKARPNDFPADTPHGSPLYRRTMRAHANCVENLPIFGAVVVTAHLAGVQSPTMDTLAQVYLAARVGQTTAHVASGRNMVINLRFAFFAVQLGCLAGMFAQILL